MLIKDFIIAFYKKYALLLRVIQNYKTIQVGTMNATLINSNSEFSKKKKYPNYIEKYVKDTSPLFLTEEDINLMRRASFRQHLLLEKTRFLLQFDYENYVNSLPETAVFQQYEQYCPSKTTSVILSAIDKYRVVYKYRKKYNEHIGISSQYNLSTEEKESLSCNNWLPSLISCAFCAPLTNHFDGKPNTTMLKALANIIHKYYYVLTHQCELPIELLMQIEILRPFANIRLDNVSGTYNFNNDRFVKSCVKSITHITDINRCQVYELIHIMDTLQDSQYLNSIIIGKKRDTDKIELNLSTPSGLIPLSLTRKDIAMLYSNRVEDDDPEVLCCVNLLKEINKEYISIHEKSWAQSILNSLCLNEKDLEKLSKIRFTQIYMNELSSIEEMVKKSNDRYKAPICYYGILFENTKIGVTQELTINRKITADVIHAMINNSNIDQRGLYEEMYTLNFYSLHSDISSIKMINKIKSEPGLQSVIKNYPTVEKILEFISPILNSNYINSNVLTVPETKQLIKDILCDYQVNKSINKERPATRRGQTKMGFNLGLVYNIIGALKNSCLLYIWRIEKIKEKEWAGDSNIGKKEEAEKQSLIKQVTAKELDQALFNDVFDTNRMKFISQYEPYDKCQQKSSFQLPDNLIFVILDLFAQARDKHYFKN